MLTISKLSEIFKLIQLSKTQTKVFIINDKVSSKSISPYIL